MRESYCGLCDDCQLGNPGFLETVSRLKGYLDQVRANVWLHCFPGPDGFSLPEFRKGLEWFLAHTECPGCKNGRGLEDCPIRVCAQARGLNTAMSARTCSPATSTNCSWCSFPTSSSTCAAAS